MASNIFTNNETDLSDIFVTGSSPGITTGYKLSNGEDISTIFNPYIEGNPVAPPTGYLIDSGAGPDISTLFSFKPVTPSNIPGLCLWLDANDVSTITQNNAVNMSRVSIWKDKSKNKFILNQFEFLNQPFYDTTNLLNGKATLSFNSSLINHLKGDAYTNNFSVGNNSYSIFAVCKITSVYGLVYSKMTGSSVNYSEFVQLGRFGNIYNRFTHTINGEYIELQQSIPSTGTTWHITELIVNRVSGNDSALENGSVRQTISYASDISTKTSSAGYPMLIGGWNASDTKTLTLSESAIFSGNIAEIVSFSNPYDMTDATRQQVEGYLAWKWGIQTNLPLDHPYSSVAP